MAQMSGGTFPCFNDGDVKIYLSDSVDDIYILHSPILKLHSDFFRRSLSDRWTGGEADTVSHWVYELKFEKDEPDGILIRQKSSNGSRDKQPKLDTTAEMWKEDLTKKDTSSDMLYTAREAFAKAHRHLLSIFYNIKPNLLSGGSDILADIRPLVNLADMYGCIEIVDVYVNSHMVNDKGFLCWLTAYPVDFLNISLMIRSAWMFKEAATQIVCGEAALWSSAFREIDHRNVKSWLKKRRNEFTADLRRVDYELLTMTALNSNHAALAFLKSWLSLSFKKGEGSSCKAIPYALVYQGIRRRSDYPPLGEFKTFTRLGPPPIPLIRFWSAS